MADEETGDIGWYSPDPRAILPLEAEPGAPGGIHLSRSLRARVRSGKFIITADRAFDRVIRACALPRPNQGGWIDDRIITAYTLLHQTGHAHSVEAWLPRSADAGAEAAAAAEAPDDPGVLVGGLYGVHIGAAFFGESMFARPDQGGTDTSKVCLIHLARQLRAAGFMLLDTQFTNPHMEQFGLVEIPRSEYLTRLKKAVGTQARWPDFAKA